MADRGYQYLIWDKLTERNIIKSLEAAQISYRSKEWQDGLKKMAEIRGKISNISIGNQLKVLIEAAREVSS